MTCHPWSLKITILGTKRVSRKMGAYQFDSIEAVQSNVARWHWTCNKIREMNLWSQDKGQENCVNAFMNSVREGGGNPIPQDEIFEVARVSVYVAELLRK